MLAVANGSVAAATSLQRQLRSPGECACRLSKWAEKHARNQAEVSGVICSGPRKGKQFTYMLLQERAAE